MDVRHERCAGIDVHKNLIVACRWVVTGGTVDKETKSFGATTRELRELAVWLREKEIVEMAMESTGVYWIPVWNVLEEEGFKLCLVNPAHFKNVPGRKSDVKDAEWLAKLPHLPLIDGDTLCRRFIAQVLLERDPGDIAARDELRAQADASADRHDQHVLAHLMRRLGLPRADCPHVPRLSSEPRNCCSV